MGWPGLVDYMGWDWVSKINKFKAKLDGVLDAAG